MTPEQVKRLVQSEAARGRSVAAYTELVLRDLGPDEGPRFLAGLSAAPAPKPAAQTAPPPCVGACVGTELKELLAELGLTETGGCGCAAKSQLIDDRGVAWATANVATIAGWLHAAAGKAGWGAKIAAGLRLARQPWWEPLAPYESIALEAIRRAEAKG